MIATPSRILLKLLQNGGIVGGTVTSTVWQGFLGPLPAEPKKAVGFTDFGADQFGQIQRTHEQVRFWRVQIMVRSLDYNDGGKYANRIDEYLRKVGKPVSLGGVGNASVTVDAETFIVPYVKPYTALGYLAKDNETGTHLWVLNERFNVESP